MKKCLSTESWPAFVFYFWSNKCILYNLIRDLNLAQAIRLAGFWRWRRRCHGTGAKRTGKFFECAVFLGIRPVDIERWHERTLGCATSLLK